MSEKKKYITTTLPYINGNCHQGHAFEFCLADTIAGYYRFKLGKENVFFNVGVDEHGQKIHQKATEEGYPNTQEYCDKYAEIWKDFCKSFQIDYDNFYRTTDKEHGEQVRRYLSEIPQHTYRETYNGEYCVGCESFKTEKEIVDGKCIIHQEKTISIKEENLFFDLKKFSSQIKDTLVNKSLSKELENILADDFKLSITRKNVKWGVVLNDEETIYVWFEALLNYILAIGYYKDSDSFDEFWEDSLIICGKDNLKFQSYILQAILLANGVPQTKEVLVHGTILDASGIKMSKSLGNVIDPIEQLQKFGLSPLKYYLTFGLNLFEDSKYSEYDLVNMWNSEIVNGIGNLISRTLHLVDVKTITPDVKNVDSSILEIVKERNNKIEEYFESYDFQNVRRELNLLVSKLNTRFQIEKPYDKESTNYVQVLNEIYYELTSVVPYYSIILKDRADDLNTAFVNNKKVALFTRL